MAAAVKIATRGPAARQAVTQITSITTGQGEPLSASVSASSTDAHAGDDAVKHVAARRGGGVDPRFHPIGDARKQRAVAFAEE